MRRTLTFLLLLILSTSLFAMAAKDLVVVAGATPEDRAYVLEKFNEKYPESTVEFMYPSMSDGSTVTMDIRLKNEEPVHVYVDFMGRVSKYCTPALALDFNKYITDQNDFRDGSLLALTNKGKLHGLPITDAAYAMSINLDMLEEIGYADFDFTDWTIDDFLEMGDAVKATYGTTKYTTMIFFQNQSGDYVWMNWLSTFGAEMYHAGDYSETVIDSEAGVNVFRWFKYLTDNGYTRPDSAIINDDDYLAAIGQGLILFGNSVPGWSTGQQKAAITQGLSDEPYPFKFVQFPKAPGVDKVPCSGSSSGVTAFQNDDPDIEEQSAYLAWLFTTAPMQAKVVREDGRYATRKSVTAVYDSPYWRQISKIVADNGLLDLGLSQQFFSEVRVEGFLRGQAVLTGEMTPAEAAADYAAAVNAILQK